MAWVVIREVGRLEADFLRSLLTSAGIPVRLEGEAIGRLYSLNAGPLGQVRVLVPAKLACQALLILQVEREQGDGEETGKSPE
ncbi:MAG: putative prokaryotic signal transducing protein [Clostridia bacterium]|nr:putative prokaryotic signal transducing protein [Clostridia bacterium]